MWGHSVSESKRLGLLSGMLAACLLSACGSHTDAGAVAQPMDPVSLARRAMAAHPWRLFSAMNFSGNPNPQPVPGSSDCTGSADLQVGTVWAFHEGAAQEDTVSVQSHCQSAPITEFLSIQDDTGDARLYTSPTSARLYMSVCWITTEQAALPASDIGGCSFGVAPNDQLVLDHYTAGITDVDRYSFSP